MIITSTLSTRARRGAPRTGNAGNAGNRRDRKGFTIVELIVAIMILTVGLLSLASTAGSMTRIMAASSRQTVAAQVAQSRIDSLSSIDCTTLAKAGATSGSSTVRGVTETWTVTDGANVKFLTDQITYKGRTQPLEYRSVITCRD